MAKENQEKSHERRKLRVYDGSIIVGYLFLAISVILIIQAILGLLSVYGIIQTMPFSQYLSGPSYIVQAFEGFFLISVIITFAFAAIGVICYVGLIQEQEWGGGISLILMGLVTLTMVLHLVVTPGVFGALNMVLESIVFGIAVLSSVYVIKHFKRLE